MVDLLSEFLLASAFFFVSALWDGDSISAIHSIDAPIPVRVRLSFAMQSEGLCFLLAAIATFLTLYRVTRVSCYIPHSSKPLGRSSISTARSPWSRI
jgi:hypothetical protein